jgi:hypothetical protein
MAVKTLPPKQFVTDRIPAILLLSLGEVFEMIRLLPSLVSAMIIDSGVTRRKELGIFFSIVGSILVVALGASLPFA